MSSDTNSLQALRAAFFNVRETRPNCHLYLLLDNSCPVAPDHPLHPDRLASRAVARERAHLGDAPAEGEPDLRPLLVQLYRAGENGYVDEELIELSVQCALTRCDSINGSYVAAWIASELDSEPLAAQLYQRCEVFDSLSAQRRRLPLYQPHRMALLVSEAIGNNRPLAMTANTRHWWFVNCAGALSQAPVETGAQLSPMAGQSAPRLSLEQARKQSRVSQARQVLLGLRKAELPVPAGAEVAIDQELDLAAKLGLRHTEDVVFFVLNSFSLSPLWHRHPRSKQLIARAAEQGAPLAGLFSELSDEELHAIGAHPSDPSDSA